MFASQTSQLCPTCGNGLEPSGDCHVCLLQLGISQAGIEENPYGGGGLPSLEALNAQFPQLEITRLIGRGGMGAIYHARQTALDRDVALKLIAKEVSSDAAFAERFEREAKTLAKLSHPHIVTIFDFGRTPDGMAYLIMEFVDGINLREAIASGSIGSDEALEVVSTICRALEYAHSKGVVHRDIKPENILLGEDGTLKVVDFGIAKIVDQSVRIPTLTATRQVLGSLHYLAPEHLEAPDQVDHRVDLYALGVVFYELLTGQLPLGRYEAPSALHDRLDKRLDAIVLKTLSRKPAQRYQNAADLDSDIAEIVTSNKPRAIPLTGAAHAESRPEQAGRRNVSVPFTCDAMGGFAEAVGVVHARADSLCAEFRVRDAFGGHVKSKTHVVEIRRGHITRLELVPGVFSSKLVVTADTISALGSFPNAETGRVELTIKRKDDTYAREVARALGFDHVRPTSSWAAALSGGPIHWPNQPSDSNRIVFSILMIICGTLNAGGLAVSEAILASELSDIGWVASSIAMAVVLGPLALIQLGAGILSLMTQPRSLGLAASVMSMLPLSPIWILSCPTGVWAYRWLKNDDPKHSTAASPGKKNWMNTTLMFVLESRWSKTVGILNTAGAVLVLAAVAAFTFGYYPANLHYRIVETNVRYFELEKAMQSRLKKSGGFRGINFDQLYQPENLTVKTWHRYCNHVEQLLSVQETPQLVWLQSVPDMRSTATSVSKQAEANRSIPIVAGMDTTSLRIEEHSLGTAVQTVGQPFALSSNLVSKVAADNTHDNGQLVVELTSSGREQLASKLAGEDPIGGLGLVIGGLVEGIATMESVSHKRIALQLSKSSKLTSDGIVAGIRGPNIPTKLELLD